MVVLFESWLGVVRVVGFSVEVRLWLVVMCGC